MHARAHCIKWKRKFFVLEIFFLMRLWKRKHTKKLYLILIIIKSRTNSKKTRSNCTKQEKRKTEFIVVTFAFSCYFFIFYTKWRYFRMICKTVHHLTRNCKSYLENWQKQSVSVQSENRSLFVTNYPYMCLCLCYHKNIVCCF